MVFAIGLSHVVSAGFIFGGAFAFVMGYIYKRDLKFHVKQTGRKIKLYERIERGVGRHEHRMRYVIESQLHVDWRRSKVLPAVEQVVAFPAKSGYVTIVASETVSRNA